VLGPIARRSGDIAGQRKAFQAGEGDVVRAADAGLEHAAAPDGDAALECGVVHGDRLGESTYAPQLDVDDPARLHLDGGQSIAPVVNGFVEADGSIEASLQHGVEVEVVVPERLLDHE